MNSNGDSLDMVFTFIAAVSGLGATTFRVITILKNSHDPESAATLTLWLRRWFCIPVRLLLTGSQTPPKGYTIVPEESGIALHPNANGTIWISKTFLGTRIVVFDNEQRQVTVFVLGAHSMTIDVPTPP